MKHCTLTLCLILMGLLAGCGPAGRSAAMQDEIDELTAANEQLQADYDQLRVRVEELDEDLRTTGFLEPQVIYEPVTFAEGGETLQQVLDRGTLRCGVNIDAPGLGYLNADTGEITGFDVDFCRAIAAAIFGELGAVNIETIPVTSRNRFTALQSGGIEVLIRNTTWTLSRDAGLGLAFATTIFYDGQGLLVRSDSDIVTLIDLADQAICVVEDNTSEQNIVDYFAALNLNVSIVALETADAMRNAYEGGSCIAMTGDRSNLVGQRMLLDDPTEHLLLEEVMSREPLGPVVRQSDADWLDIVSWVVQCTLNAEYLGVSQSNVASQLESEDIHIQRLLGGVDELGQTLGLRNDFCYQVVAQVGNYGEIYNRNFGPDTLLKLPRGENALFLDGGLLYPLPFQ